MNEKDLNNGTGRWHAAFLKPQASSLKSAVALVGVALVLALPSAASADPIRFDNAPVSDPNHFVWYGGTGTNPIGLNIMTDLAGQDGSYNGVGDLHQSTELTWNNGVSGGLADGQLQVGGPYGDSLLSVDIGTAIPSGLAWAEWAFTWVPGDPVYLPLDTPTYLGVQFPDTDGTHYGWIGVVASWLPESGGSGADALCLDAFAWGYETMPDTPIAAGVPEPGTLALLAFGACAAIRRRR